MSTPGDAEVIEAAVEAAARTMYLCPIEELGAEDAECARATARGMVEAALPIIAKHAAAKALRDAADHWQACKDNDCGWPHGAEWLRQKARIIDRAASIDDS